MGTFQINDLEFDADEVINKKGFQNGRITGQQFKDVYSDAKGISPNSGAASWVKEKGADTIRLLEPNETVDASKVEQVGFVNPFNTAGHAIRSDEVREGHLCLIVRDHDWKALRRHLFREDRLERQAFLELGMARDDKGDTHLFLHKILPVADEEYQVQSRVQVMPSGQATVAAYNSFAHSGVAGHGHVHSHPFTEHASFSCVDRDCLAGMMDGIHPAAQALQVREPIHCLLMVMGTDPYDFHAELVGPDKQSLGQVNTLKIISPTGITLHQKYQRSDRKFPLFNALAQQAKAISDDGRQMKCESQEKQRRDLLDRNIQLLGQEGQSLIGSIHLALCGAGGAGAMLVANLRGMGFREFTLIDPEKLEPSNLNRFPGAGLEDIGSYKVDVLKRELQRVFPDTIVHAFRCGVEGEEARQTLVRADILVAGVDGMAPRAELQVLAARLLKPLIDLGTGIRLDKEGKINRMGGQVIVYVPGGPCLKCQGLDIFRPEAGLAGRMRRATGYVEDTDFTPTSVAFINSLAAGLAADLLISHLTGLRAIPSYIEFDQWNWQLRSHAFAKRPSCTVCGEKGIEGKGLSIADNLFEQRAMHAVTR